MSHFDTRHLLSKISDLQRTVENLTVTGSHFELEAKKYKKGYEVLLEACEIVVNHPEKENHSAVYCIETARTALDRVRGK